MSVSISSRYASTARSCRTGRVIRIDRLRGQPEDLFGKPGSNQEPIDASEPYQSVFFKRLTRHRPGIALFVVRSRRVLGQDLSNS